MNDLDIDPADLERLLHERVGDLHPDLGARAARAIRVGTRIRRRRRVGAGLGAVAGVAAVGAAGYQLVPGAGPDHAEAGFAGGPTASPSALVTAHATGCGTGGSPTLGDQQDTSSLQAMCASEASQPSPHSSPTPEKLPVTLDAPGWRCDQPADEKFICTSGGASAQVTMRPANEYQAYTTDPDKVTPGQYVSAVHGDVFAVIVPGPNTAATTVQQLGRYLVWN
ncbi:MAG TPA: hypothetical protein VFJ19_19270 [Nocardioidaceae bacterium]|nr:hypothetical protein [Nocardioidaceae bacterium]